MSQQLQTQKRKQPMNNALIESIKAYLVTLGRALAGKAHKDILDLIDHVDYLHEKLEKAAKATEVKPKKKTSTK